MASKKRGIGLVPIEEIPWITSKSIAAYIMGYLNLNADILPPLSPPHYALDKKRLQYNAAAIIKTIESQVPQDFEKVLGILDVDIFVPILTHVFDEAQQGGRCGVISLYRLKKFRWVPPSRGLDIGKSSQGGHSRIRPSL